MIKLDKKHNKLLFSSAGRPLFLLRNGEILEYKGAKFPAGGAQHGEKEFPLIEIDLEPGDRIFMCSDGITDQFGGPQGRKFSPKRLKETLLAHQDKDLQAQGAAFAEAFDGWQKSANVLTEMYIHLWPNAYKDNTTAFARQQRENGQTKFWYAPEEDRGYIDSLDFRVKGKPLKWNYWQGNWDIALLQLAEPLRPGESVSISRRSASKSPRRFRASAISGGNTR